MTLRPGDGVIPGKYKVFFSASKTVLDRESLIAAKYTSVARTPFTVTVKEGENPPLDFVLERLARRYRRRIIAASNLLIGDGASVVLNFGNVGAASG